MKARRVRNREGMALLTVLLLVAVMAAVCVLILDDVRFAVRRTGNVEHQGELQALAGMVEAVARHRLTAQVRADPQRTPLTPRWDGQVEQHVVEETVVRAVVRDGQACFNINSLVSGQGEDLRPNPLGAQQFVELGVAAGLPRGRMQAVADAVTDWMDSDQTPTGGGGAEDERYAARSRPYRTAGLMMAEVSEMRAVHGVDAGLYARLRPYLCALPEARLTRVNINTVPREQAPVLVALGAGRMRLADAQAALAARPVAGWRSADEFWSMPVLNAVVADDVLRGQTTVITRYFDLRIDIEADSGRAVRTALIHVTPEDGARTVMRRWTPEE